MKFSLLVALAHLRSNKDTQGISVITLISMLGVTVGVTALIMVLAVMEGFELDLRDKILGSNAHIVVINFNGNFNDYAETTQTISSIEGIQAATPFIYSEMMIRSPKAGYTNGILYWMRLAKAESSSLVRFVASNTTPS